MANVLFGRRLALSLGGFVLAAVVGQAPAQPAAAIDEAENSAPAPLDSAPAHDATVGTMAGQAGTDGGAAVYQVPIVVPPGRAGMQPSLSLGYNSRGGDGIAGMGWSISGASSIHRCPQTPEQDSTALGSYKPAVTYTNDDRLCLDGQRLVKVNGGVYGQTGSEYRTEVDSFARIFQTGGDLAGTAVCFRVEEKDGRIRNYGAVTTGSPIPTGCASSGANARVRPTGAPATLSWQLEKIEDRVGNNQLYGYTNFGNGEVLLHTVTYTGYTPTGAVGDRTVTLNYEARATAATSGATDFGPADTASSYLAGGLTMQTQALQSIVTAVGGTIARRYTPTYTTAFYSHRLLMTDLQECAANGSGTACHPSTHFEFNDNLLNFPFTSLQAMGLPPPATTASMPLLYTIGDLDGDGTREVAAQIIRNDGTHVFLMQMTGDRSVHGNVDMTTVPFCILPSCYADIDGSGRSALIEVGSSGTLAFGIWNPAIPRGTVVTSSPLIAVSSNIPYSSTSLPHGQQQNVFAADVDGDGKTDIVVVKPASTSAFPAGCGPADAIGNKDGVFVYLNTMAAPLMPGQTATFAPLNSGAPLFCLQRTVYLVGGNSYDEAAIDHISDFDGNGLPDFYLTYGGHAVQTGNFAGITLTQRTAGAVSAAIQGCAQIGLVSDGVNPDDECAWKNGYATHWMDVNGDGLEDFVIARPNQGQWQLRLNQGNGHLGTVITPTGASAEGLTNYGSPPQFRYANRLPIMDVDGDGKPDLVIPSKTQGIHGFALKMCTINAVAPLANGEGCPRADGGSIAGQQDAPGAGLTCPAYSCPENPDGGPSLPANSDDMRRAGFPYQWNDLPAFGSYNSDSAHGGPGGDNSVYHLAMLKFVQTGPSAFRLQLVETPLISRLSNTFNHTDDLFGDGLQDLVTDIGCLNEQLAIGNGSYPVCSVVNDNTYGPRNLPPPDNSPTANFETQVALYASLNQGVANLGGSPSAPGVDAIEQPAVPTITTAMRSTPLLPTPILPGLLDAAINGLGDTASWGYLPLSVPSSQAGVALYTVSGGYEDARHYYFQSSMPAVFGMLQSSGTGASSAVRSALYGYDNAMYNHWGRGFQGFQEIITENENLVRTTTTYHQKFPLVGKVASVSTGVTDAVGQIVHPIQTETATWRCTRSNRNTLCPGDNQTALPVPSGVYQPFLDRRFVQNTDLATGVNASHVDTVNAASTAASVSGWDANGNLVNQWVGRGDDGAGGSFVSSHTVSTANSYYAADITNWWLDKLNQSTVTTAIAYASGHALPTGASAPSRSVTSSYQWNANHTPLSQTLQPGVANQQRTTTYSYPAQSYGLPTSIAVAGSAVSPSPRTTWLTYTKNGTTNAVDGYFVLDTTNSALQTGTTRHAASDGQITSDVDPNYLETTSAYDPFGRVIAMTFLDSSGAALMPSANVSYEQCDNDAIGRCGDGTGYGEDANQAWAAYRVTRVQNGSPTEVSWFDLLDRKIKQVERGFGGTFVETLTDYNDDGTVAQQSTPFFLGSVPYFTGWLYDALGRPLQKNAPGAELDPAHGNIVTTYDYKGSKTTIKVRGASVSATCSSTTNLCMDMSRSYDMLGRLEQTVQNNGNVASYAVTNYWYDGAGNPVAAKDAEANVIHASYDDSGRRTDLYDPDAGHSSFTYDALGELLRQTDARAVYTDHVYDAIGRLVQRTANNPASTDPELRVLRDTWSYDPTGTQGGRGLLGSAQRLKGSSANALSPTWSESYSYETATKRLHSETSVLEGQASPWWTTSYTYDGNGREDTITYPSSLVVGKDYTTYGDLNRLSNASSGSTYWMATAKDAWGNVTGETFAGNVTGSHIAASSTGQIKQKKWTGGTGVLDQWDYSYDSFGNVKSQSRSASGAATATESYAYDGLQRLISATRGNVPGTPLPITYGYRPSGSLDYKSDFSLVGPNAYQYGGNGCGPHAVSQVARSSSSQTYTCDASGNVTGGNTLAATYDFNNQPWQVSRVAAGSAQFAYSANGEVFREQATSHDTWFGPRGYEVTQPLGGQSVQRHELGPVIVLRQNGTDTVRTILRDRLGSQVLLKDAGTSPTGLSAPILSVSPVPSLDGHYTATWTSVSGASAYVLKEQVNGAAPTTVYSGSGTNWSPPTPKVIGSYAYAVQACNGSCSPDSNAVTEEVVPGPPTTFTVTPNPSTNGSYTVSWSSVSGASSYALEELSPGGNWASVSSGSLATNWSTSGRASGVYSYRIHSCLTACGAYSPTITETVQGTSGLSPPASISAAPNPSANGAYTVSWSAVSGATSYKLEELVAGAWSPVSGISGTTKAFSGRPNGSYGYRAQACNANGCGGYSATTTETVNIQAPPGVPGPITSNQNPSADGNYTLSWSAVAGTSIVYTLEETTAPYTWVVVATQAGTSWTRSNQVDGSWGYRVKACKNGVCGGYSASYTQLVAHAPAVPNPVTLAPNPSSGHFTVSWGNSPGATFYWVEEQVNAGTWQQLDTTANPTALSMALDRGSGSYAYHVKACAVTSGQSRCSTFTTPMIETVQGSPIPPEPAWLTGPSQCTSSPCTYTISWAPVSTAQTYEVHTTTDVTGIDTITSYPGAVTSTSITASAGHGFSQVMYIHEVRACTGVDPNKLCSPYRGPLQVMVGRPDAPETVPAATAYDAFGQARNGDFSDKANGRLNLLPDTLRGFTGHEHVDDVWLIHMGGRVYDYQLGRFLSVDPVIQNPANSQSLNPYSYILNNPLSGKDPTGYQSCTTGTNISGGRNCEDLGVSVSQMGSPSVTAMKGEVFHEQSRAIMQSIFGHSSGADSMTANGSNSKPLNGQASSIGGPSGTVDGIASATPRTNYDEWSQGNLFERAAAGVVAFIGSLHTPFTSEDQYGNTHNPVTGEPMLAADAKNLRLATLASAVVPIGAEERVAAKEVQALLPVVEREIVIIGEDMQGRVIPTAQGLGAHWYNPPPAPPEKWMGNNRAWINKKMDQGCRILDCGAAPGRANFPNPTSPYYKMEGEQIQQRNYPWYEPIKAYGE